MDIFNLNEKVNGLVSYLQDTGYSAMYIGYVKKMAEWLSGNARYIGRLHVTGVPCSYKYTCWTTMLLVSVQRR